MITNTKMKNSRNPQRIKGKLGIKNKTVDNIDKIWKER